MRLNRLLFYIQIVIILLYSLIIIFNLNFPIFKLILGVFCILFLPGFNLINLIRPKFFMPVHGEAVMQTKHAKTAIEAGVSKKNIFIKANGGRVMVKDGIVTSAGSVPAEDIFVDETSLTGQSQKVIADRNKMAKNGVVVVTVGIDSKKNEIISLFLELRSLSKTLPYMKLMLLMNFFSSIA